MKAIQVHTYGGPDVLELEEVPRPQPAPDEVLVKVYATGVNPVDWKMRKGYRQHPLPFIPGWDVSGVVEETGKRVTDLQIGDEVYGRPDTSRNGSYAEYITVKASELGHKPASIDYIAAAAIPLAGLTAWQALFEHAKLKNGQKLFIHGASGGVGTYAVEFAKWKGAYVIGTASSQNLSFLKELGADEAIDYHERDFEKQFTDIDVVFDTIGGDTQKRSLQMLKPGGILVTTVKVEDEAAFKQKGVRITGMFTTSKKEDLEAIAQLVDEGRVKPIVSKVLPLEAAEEAHRISEDGHVRGKIVLRVREEGE
jgi:NADPH:quinone reductase-like Zn-dependent oxidoreductase